jgi:hypothetical protein
MADASGSLRLPAGEAGVLAESVRLAMGCVGGRCILGAYLLSEEQRSLLECQASDAATSAMPTAEVFAFAWNAGLVRAMGLHATWRPLLQAPLHPLEVSSKLSLPAQTEGHDDAWRALTAASRRSGRTAVLLRVGAAVSSVRQAAAAAAARAAHFDAAAVRADAAAGTVTSLAGEVSRASTPPSSGPFAPAPFTAAHRSNPPGRLKVVDFMDRSIACLTRDDGFSHLSALGPRGEAEALGQGADAGAAAWLPPPMDSMHLSLARIRAEAFLGAAADATAPAGLNAHESIPGGAGRGGGWLGGVEYQASVVCPCVMHLPRTSEAGAAHARLALAAAQLRAREEERTANRQPGGDQEGQQGWPVCEPRAWHGPLRGALPSQHNLPECGNWVRMSAAQQVPASRPARPAARPSVHSTFGSEPRLSSASCRWSYQTALPFTRRGPIPEAVEAGIGSGAVPAGSFLPLRLVAAGDSCQLGVPHAPQGAAATSLGHRGSGPQNVQSSPQQAHAAHQLLGALSGLVGTGGAAARGAQPSDGTLAPTHPVSGHAATKESEVMRPSAWGATAWA